MTEHVTCLSIRSRSGRSAFAAVIFTCTLAVVPSGCVSISEFQREVSHKTDAKKLLKGIDSPCHSGASARHFERGFVRGYTRFAMTGDDSLPLVADKQYRTFLYDSPQGRAHVDTWFDGYRQGVESAKHAGVGEYVIVPTGRFSPLERPFDPAAVTTVVTPDAGAESLDPYNRGPWIDPSVPPAPEAPKSHTLRSSPYGSDDGMDHHTSGTEADITNGPNFAPQSSFGATANPSEVGRVQ